MKRKIITLSLMLTSAAAWSQTGQYRTPQKLDTLINSEAEEVMPLFTADGNTMYFVRAFHPQNAGGEITGHDIWMSRRINDTTWTEPSNVSSLNNDGSNAVIGISRDGNTLYLMNPYLEDMKTEPGVSISRRNGTTWAEPEFIPIPGLTPTTRLYGFFVTPEENAMIISMETKGTLGMEDLYVSTKDPMLGWTVPVNLGPSVNTDKFEISPWLSPDGTRLFFSSNRGGGYGDADIYLSERQGNSWTNWSEPENLGARINSSGFDAYFTMYDDSTVYFSSNRDGELSQIYYTKLEPVPAPVVVERREPSFIFFEFDKYYLTEKSKEVLSDISDTLKDMDEYTVVLEGHTDHKGTDQYNVVLGQNRANSAMKYLVDKGINKNRIKTENYGESRPMAPNTHPDGSDNPEGRALNRRVVIRLLPPDNMATATEVIP